MSVAPPSRLRTIPDSKAQTSDDVGAASPNEREPTERRPWGAFTVVDAGAGFQVKRIAVRPGGQLSLQSHQHRAEHWTVISGEATVTVGADVRRLHRGQSVDIAVGEHHRLQNFGAEDVVVVEVQFGNYLGEDDTVRYEDAYGRN